MAFDILIADSHGNAEKLISLYIEEYDFIMEKIEPLDNFSIIKKSLSNYYGESEVYLNELDNLKLEVLAFEENFQSFYPQAISAFISDFLKIIDYAIKDRRTLKFIGD
jgi:hypothetical protein